MATATRTGMVTGMDTGTGIITAKKKIRSRNIFLRRAPEPPEKRLADGVNSRGAFN